jgi:hypothetical protein
MVQNEKQRATRLHPSDDGRYFSAAQRRIRALPPAGITYHQDAGFVGDTGVISVANDKTQNP